MPLWLEIVLGLVGVSILGNFAYQIFVAVTRRDAESNFEQKPGTSESAWYDGRD